MVVVDRLSSPRTGFSVEFFPPRDENEERILWRAVREIEPFDPAFISVTYGAGGSTRNRTIRTTRRIIEETTLTTMAHLAAVDHSVAELRDVIGRYAISGVRNVLAIRGDPPGDPDSEWRTHPQGLTHAEELVRLVRELGDFCVGVAAFPHGHPRSVDLDTDLRYLVRKIQAGAEFAIAQLFLRPEVFLRLRDRLAARGREVPLVPGVMPITTPKVLAKFGQLAGVPIPPEIARKLGPLAHDPAAFRAAGVELVRELCERLIGEGVPALHFYTLNRSKATREVITDLGLGRTGTLQARELPDCAHPPAVDAAREPAGRVRRSGRPYPS